MKLFVGLGNPGDKYARHRHNVGFMAVDAIATRHGFPAWRKRFQALCADGEIAGRRVLLMKPATYMNESGQSAGEAARFLKIAETDVVAFHDELDLSPGKIRVKSGGGNAGHNGLRSLSAHLGNDYQRVRIGIGHPGNKDLVHHWVLNDFAKADAAWLDPLLAAIADAAGQLASGDSARFMTDVARALQLPTEEAARSAVKSDAPAKERANNGSIGGGGQHPAGERMAKRQSALAANIKKWMARNRKPED